MGTGNPSVHSSTKGWKLLGAVCKTAAPSIELAEFLRAFLRKAANPDIAAAMEELNEALRRASVCAVAERRRSDWTAQVAAFTGERPKMATEALEALEVAAAAQQRVDQTVVKDLVEVHTEDGRSVCLKFKSAMNLHALHARMVKALTIQNGDTFDFFATEFEDDCPPWRLLSRDMKVLDAVSHVAMHGQFVTFG